jgi:hypothetical protein
MKSVVVVAAIVLVTGAVHAATTPGVMTLMFVVTENVFHLLVSHLAVLIRMHVIMILEQLAMMEAAAQRVTVMVIAVLQVM